MNATTIGWLATAYFFTLSILVPVTGILMQKVSTRHMFMTAILLSLVGEPTQAAATGSALVFKISLILAVINVVLSLFLKKPKS